MIRTIAILLCLLSFSRCLIAEEPKPNIVVVLFDDMGWTQPQSYDADSALRTPHFDRLAEQGMRFTDAHAAAAVCTPTRYGLLTGRYPSRIGQFGVLTTYSKPIIPPSRLTMASMLQREGYATACIGKWHLGMQWLDGKPGKENSLPIGSKMKGGPNELGFDYFYGFTHARNIGTIIEQDQVVANVSASENQPLMIEKAVEWIEARKENEPFFLYFPMCPPHTPIVPTPNFAGNSGAQDLIKNDPAYGDWLFQGDAMLGEILATLDRNGLADNTVVIATSDNGAEQRAYHPLRDSKRSIYEGGHRVPFVVRWPNKVVAGSTNSHTICLNDLMATAAEMVGASIPDNVGEDSVSRLGEFLSGASQDDDGAVVHQSMRGDLAIRRGPWKLIFHQDGRRELFNLESDLSESKDVSAEYASIVDSLTTRMQAIIDNGRSTGGKSQSNDAKMTIAAPQRRSN